MREARLNATGNHAQALALAARENGIPAHIIMPSISNPMKVAATKGYGAKVYFSGSTAPEREALAAEVIKETGAQLVAPYDHPDVILGQGKPLSLNLLRYNYPYNTSREHGSRVSLGQWLTRDRYHRYRAPGAGRRTTRGRVLLKEGP